jgi:hypothetical protein
MHMNMFFWGHGNYLLQHDVYDGSTVITELFNSRLLVVKCTALPSLRKHQYTPIAPYTF